jgi:hypothetical protein
MKIFFIIFGMLVFIVWLYRQALNIPPLSHDEDFFDDNSPAVSPEEKILENEVEKFLNDKDEIELREKLDEIKKEV